MLHRNSLLLLSLAICFFSCSTTQNLQTARDSNLSFEITLPSSLSNEPLDGRLLLLIANNNEKEPRFQIADGPNTQLAFGIDVENFGGNQTATFDATAFGYPLKSISQIPKGEYYVQALLNVYETFNRADGHIVKLPADNGEGQQWNRSPGNVYSKPKKILIDPTQKVAIKIELDQKIAPIEPPFIV